MVSTTKPSTGHLPIRMDWLAKGNEEILEPDLPIIDPHHHLWDRPGSRYLLDDLVGDTGSGHNIVATVFVECGSMYRSDGDIAMRPIGETEFVAGTAAMAASGRYGPTKACAGIVAYADLNLGADIAPVLEEQIRAGRGKLRGVRYVSAWHPDPAARGTPVEPIPGILMQDMFRQGFARLAPHGLSFDAWLYHTQLPELVDLARAFPETTIVLDHVGGTIGIGPYRGRTKEAFAEWISHIRELSRCQNVVVKLGGFGMRLFGFTVHEAPVPPTGRQLAELWRPYIETTISMFGVERCMFESNFPVDKGSCSYSALWNAFKLVSGGASADERAALFSGTAARVYKLTTSQ